MRRFVAAFTLFLCGCGAVKQEEPSALPHRFASESEGVSLLLANRAYYDGFSQNDIDYRMQKKNVSMVEFLAFAGEQALAFSDEETALINDFIASMEKTLQDNRYTLPALDEIVFIKTTGLEEGQASAYTHGTQIFLNEELLQYAAAEEDFPLPPSVFAYHISNPDVAHHNAFASFSINGQETECFVDTVTTKHFEEPGDLFF